MSSIPLIEDKDLELSIELSDGRTVQEFATDLAILWYEKAGSPSAVDRYQEFKQALETRWGCSVSKGSAFLIAEAALTKAESLKKTL